MEHLNNVRGEAWQSLNFENWSPFYLSRWLCLFPEVFGGTPRRKIVDSKKFWIFQRTNFTNTLPKGLQIGESPFLLECCQNLQLPAYCRVWGLKGNNCNYMTEALGLGYATNSENCMSKRSICSNIEIPFLFLLNRDLCWSLHPWMLFYSLISVLNCLILALYCCLWSECERNAIFAGALADFFQ